MLRNQVTEGSTARFDVAFSDPSGAPATPLQVFVTIYCRTSGTTIRAETTTAVTGSTVSIVVTDAENALVSPDAITELRRIRVRATYGIGDEFVTLQDYLLAKALP